MKIAFRADASVLIGTGHVMRCLTLADELTRLGHQCQFICREHEGHLEDLIVSKGYKIYLLSCVPSIEQQPAVNTDNAHADWLGATWQEDAEQTLKVLSLTRNEWLVVDHYALDVRWERQVAKAVDHIMVIDDLADRAHEANLLLDQNVLSTAMKECYKKQVNSDCELLLGPRYALLGQEYGFLAAALPERDGRVSRVLIFVGGSDPHHLTERYLKALNADDLQHLQVDVVIGKNHPAPYEVFDLVSGRENTRLYSGLPSLAALMIRADLMLGAGGATNWERMCLGLNSIVTSVARNQRKVNEDLCRRQLLHFLGDAEEVTTENIRATLNLMVGCPLEVSEQSKRMRECVDGNGCKRVSKLLCENFARINI